MSFFKFFILLFLNKQLFKNGFIVFFYGGGFHNFTILQFNKFTILP